MKRIAILLIVLISLTLAACVAAPSVQVQESSSFYGKILSIYNGSVQVEALEGEAVRASSDQFSFSDADLPDIGAAVGDYVHITFTGNIQETYPAQMTVTDWSLIPVRESQPDSVPAMTISYGTDSTFIDPYPPTQWSRFDTPGSEATTSLACGASPLDTRAAPLSLTHKGTGPVVLLSDWLPDEVTAIAWPEEILALSAEDRQAQYDTFISLETKSTGIQLPKDGQGYLVLVTAQWSDKQDGKTPFGSTCYRFLIQPDAAGAQGA